MSNKTRVLHVRVVGFSAPERQMLNSIFLLSVAPARQIGYKLWNPEAGLAPDMYLLDGDKRIIAKKVTEEQIDEILALKQKQQ